MCGQNELSPSKFFYFVILKTSDFCKVERTLDIFSDPLNEYVCTADT